MNIKEVLTLKGNNGLVYHQSEQLTNILQSPVSYGDVPMQFFLHVLYGANKNMYINSFQLIRKTIEYSCYIAPTLVYVVLSHTVEMNHSLKIIILEAMSFYLLLISASIIYLFIYFYKFFVIRGWIFGVTEFAVSILVA